MLSPTSHPLARTSSPVLLSLLAALALFPLPPAHGAGRNPVSLRSRHRGGEGGEGMFRAGDVHHRSLKGDSRRNGGPGKQGNKAGRGGHGPVDSLGADLGPAEVVGGVKKADPRSKKASRKETREGLENGGQDRRSHSLVKISAAVDLAGTGVKRSKDQRRELTTGSALGVPCGPEGMCPPGSQCVVTAVTANITGYSCQCTVGSMGLVSPWASNQVC